MAKKESKKKSQIMLWVGISFISVAVITFLIFGFSTQWTFKPNSTKSNKPNKQSNNGNVEPLFNDNNNRKSCGRFTNCTCRSVRDPWRGVCR